MSSYTISLVCHLNSIFSNISGPIFTQPYLSLSFILRTNRVSYHLPISNLSHFYVVSSSANLHAEKTRSLYFADLLANASRWMCCVAVIPRANRRILRHRYELYRSASSRFDHLTDGGQHQRHLHKSRLHHSLKIQSKEWLGSGGHRTGYSLCSH